ncbi:hypothetical protein PHET_04251, partial [Paragonimus heterotremus]
FSHTPPQHVYPVLGTELRTGAKNLFSKFTNRVTLRRFVQRIETGLHVEIDRQSFTAFLLAFFGTIMIHSASLTDPTVAYPHFNPYPTSNFPGPVVSLPEHHVSNAHPGSVNGLSSATVAALTAAAAASAGIPPNVKDSRWLTLEVCRQYQRNQCSRDENECKFAHPPMHVDVQNGRVVCCYDSIKRSLLSNTIDVQSGQFEAKSETISLKENLSVGAA